MGTKEVRNFRKRRRLDDPDKIPRFKLSFVIKISVLIVLTAITFHSVYIGPVCNLERNSTKFRKNYLNDEDQGQHAIIRPSLSICKLPFYRNWDKYQEFVNKSAEKDFESEMEYNKLVDEAFFNQPEDFLLGFNIGKHYDGAMVNEMGRMPVAEPYIKIVLVDFVYNGFCAMLSFKAMNQFLIDQGEANASENDFSYSLFIVLNGENMPKDGKSFFKFVMEGEDLLAGAETVTEEFMGELTRGTMGIYLMDFEIITRIRNCNNYPIMSPCVTKYFDEKYGKDMNSEFEKTKHRSQKTFEGLFASENTTGCKLPCELTTYPVKEYRIFDMEYFTDPAVQNFLTKNNYTKSSAIMINHQKPKELIQYEEVLEYDSSDFISDAGGTVGIFVGLSFWSVYESVFGPIFQWLEKKFLKCEAVPPFRK